MCRVPMVTNTSPYKAYSFMVAKMLVLEIKPVFHFVPRMNIVWVIST